MRISDWSSDVCSSDLHRKRPVPGRHRQARVRPLALGGLLVPAGARGDLQARRLWQRAAPSGAVRAPDRGAAGRPARSEEHTSELQSLMRTSYAVFCLKKKNTKKQHLIVVTHINETAKVN